MMSSVLGKGRIQGTGAKPGDGEYRNNQLLRLLPRTVIEGLGPALERVELERGACLFEPGEDVTHTHFPLAGTVVAFVLPMRDGRVIEGASIGREGAVGGVVSLGVKPAFSRAVVQIPGALLRIRVTRLEGAKRAAPKLHEVFTRYADCLIAQVLQSVGCATAHPLEARAARWLLMVHDRLARPELPLTQEMLADTFGATRTYVTRIANTLQTAGVISYRRGVIRIMDRKRLAVRACECYALIRQHYDRILPGLYPSEEP